MKNWFQCPGCGALIPDKKGAEILTCEHCGSTITKYIPKKTILVKDVGPRIENVEKMKLEAEERKRKKDDIYYNIAIIWGLVSIIISFIMMFARK